MNLSDLQKLNPPGTIDKFELLASSRGSAPHLPVDLSKVDDEQLQQELAKHKERSSP